jgi:hypothetical protein
VDDVGLAGLEFLNLESVSETGARDLEPDSDTASGYRKQQTALNMALTAVNRRSSESAANWFISKGITGYMFMSLARVHKTTEIRASTEP